MSPTPGVLHNYGFNLTAFEFTDSRKPAPNVLLFVAGLFNGYLNVPYLPQLQEAVAQLPGNWVLVQTLITSSFKGWGMSSLDRDTKELRQLIQYLRSDSGGSRKKIVLIGHSTGCQDTMQYLTKRSLEEGFPRDAQIDAAILQAPVSDLEAVSKEDLSVDSTAAVAQQVYDEYILKGRAQELLPLEYTKIAFDAPITAYRFHSLFSPRGDDDYFSSYLTPEDYRHTFGIVSKPLLVLYGDSDEFVPDYVDKQKLIDSWKRATPSQYWSPLSQLIPGATHDIGSRSAEGAVAIFVSTVIQFLEQI